MGLGQLKNASAEEIRSELMSLLQLALLDDLVFNSSNRNDIGELARKHLHWLEIASDREITEKGPALMEANQPTKKRVLNRLPFKASWRATAGEFMEGLASGEFSAARGVPLRWLDHHFDLSRLPEILPDFPHHARVGLGHSKHQATIEEHTLLCDAFLFLERARTLHQQLLQELVRLKKLNTTSKPPHLDDMSLNVCTHARMSLFTFFAFAECFVNSVGEDFISRNPALATDAREHLKGRRKGGFYSLEKKLEKFPEIINPGGKVSFVLSDPKQMKEPFTTFLRVVKETRDSIAHHAEGKAPIWLGPQDWMDKADTAARTTLDCSKLFWKACYPKRDFPEYLHRLHLNEFEKHATARLESERKIFKSVELSQPTS
jgi:hypothetical protein